MAVTREAKRRRLELKSRKRQQISAQETREGLSYQSEIDLTSNTCEECIPPPSTELISEPVSTHGSTEVFFDLEATGLARTSHITQISALRGEEAFATYVIPKQRFTEKASAITGLTMQNGRMYHQGCQVEAVSIKMALQGLVKFLNASANNILVGHNIQSYDCHLLLNALSACDMIDSMAANCIGFLDTRKLFRIMKPGLPSYSQKSLVETLLRKTYAAHDAVEDVKALQELVSSHDISTKDKEKASFTFINAKANYTQSVNIRRNSPSFQELLDNKVLSRAMINKLSGSGLCYRHLQLAYRRNGIDGITDLFTETNDSGRPRVTKSKKIISDVTGFLSKRVNES